MTKFHLDFLIDAFYQIGHVLLEVAGTLGVVDLEARQVAGVTVITHNLARTIDDRYAQVHHLWYAHGFQCHFNADAVGVTNGDADFESVAVIVFAHYLINILLMSFLCD